MSGDGSDYRHPLLVPRDDLDLSQLRRHVREHHSGRLLRGRPAPRSNRDLAGWHASLHHRMRGTHTHRGPLVLITRPDRTSTIGQIVVPLGNYTGQDTLTREQAQEEFKAKMEARRS